MAPLTQRMRRALERARRRELAPQMFPPGHFYSPVVDTDAVLADAGRVWPDRPPDPDGLDLRGDDQVELLEALVQHRPAGPIGSGATAYVPDNGQFPPVDASLLYAMIGWSRPRRIVEVGSGWSTTVISAAVRDHGLDTRVTCVEPHPTDLIRSLEAVVTLRVEKVQHTPLSLFDELTSGDILFIDSSHVAKTGSDVLFEILQVLPRLAPGVVVHVHDIFIPEDYPRDWVAGGFNWNEQYLLHAFLMGNTRARVLAATNWLRLRHPGALEAAFGLEDSRGSSFWFVPTCDDGETK